MRGGRRRRHRNSSAASLLLEAEPPPLHLHPKVDKVLTAVTLQFTREGLTPRELDEVRSKLKYELGQRLVSLGEGMKRKCLAREKVAALSTALTEQLGRVEFERNLKKLLNPETLRKEFEHQAHAFEKTHQRNNEAILPSPEMALLSGKEASGVGAAKSRKVASTPKRTRRTRHLDLPSFVPDITAWTDEYLSRPSTVEARTIRDVAAASTVLPGTVQDTKGSEVVRRDRPIRERYLTSILKSVLVSHDSGNTILDDYPLPKSFKDALAAFPDEPSSIRQLRFKPVEFTAPRGTSKDEKLLLFSPEPPFMNIQEVDDGSDTILRLRPPLSPSSITAPTIGLGTDLDLDMVCDEIRCALRTNTPREQSYQHDLIVTELIQDIWHLDPQSTLECPMPRWHEQHLGRLAVSGKLREQIARYNYSRGSRSQTSPHEAQESGLPATEQQHTFTQGITDLQSVLELIRLAREIQFEEEQRAAEQDWAAEAEPRPIPRKALRRIESVWEKLGIVEVERLDFICKYSHRSYAPHLANVLDLYEHLLEPVDAARRAVTFFSSLSNPTDDDDTKSAAQHAMNLVDAITSLSESLKKLHVDFGESSVTIEDEGPLSNVVNVLRQDAISELEELLASSSS